VLVVTRFTVDAAGAPDFAERAAVALAALADCPGYRRGTLGQAADDPAGWVLVTEWDGVGAYRRALSRYQVKVAATPLLAQAHDEPSAFEVLREVSAGGAVVVHTSDRATTGGRDA
jgi:Antibiotic biosynthesis monooxygenase